MKYFKRNGFVALVSMLSLAAYAEDILPLSVAGSETKEFIQASGYGIDTSNMIQQERIIQGTVLEEGTNEPLIGVNVVVKGTTIGTTTDIDGKYSIKIPSDKAVLVFSYIGQKTEEYSVKGLSLLNVVMKSDATMLSEVVVYTGYMTQKKADLTGSVAMASASDLKKNASANAMKSLQGKMAGVHITTNGGNPAEGATVQIRGLSSLSGGVKPLIVLDGMPTENLNLRDINAGDIESIQVLKDAASASIYGARASGGVILIQTKKGQAGKTSIEYNGSVSINTVLNKPALMNAEQYGRAAFQAQAYDERVYGTSISLPSAYDYTWHRGDNGMAVLDGVKVAEFLNADQTVRGSDTDWMGEVFQTAVSHNHQLTISNGSEKSKSLFSLGYFNNEGTQIHTFFRQYSVRANTEYSLIKNRLKVGENLAVSYLQYRDQSETWWAMINPPASPVYDENGGWAGAPGFDDFTNPVRLLKMNKDNINNYVKIIGNIFLDLNIWKGISARTQFGLDYGNAYNRAVDGVWSETGGRNSDGENYVGSYQSHPLSYVWTNTLSYTLSTGKHNLDVVLGTEATRFVQEGFSARREGIYLEDRDFAHIGVTTGEKYNLGSSADEYTYFSLFGKANYVYNGKYYPYTWNPKESPYHILDMSWTALLMLRWYDELEKDARLLAYAEDYAMALLGIQYENGFFPGWLDLKTMQPMNHLNASPETSLSVTFLLKLYELTHKEEYKRTAFRAMNAVIHEIIPVGKWEDFETYWSCSRYGSDNLVGKKVLRNNMHKQNNFSMFWTAEALLECYRLTSNKEYLDYGQRTLDELLMTQASWQPPYMYVNVLGGFGVLNADGEWNDSRESLFSELIIQYGKLLDKPEYIERGYAALKASFVMMYCTENPQTKQQWEKVHPFFASEDYGFMMENYGHGGRTNPAGEGMGEFTIYDWGNGAAAEAYNRILDKFGKIE